MGVIRECRRREAESWTDATLLRPTWPRFRKLCADDVPPKVASARGWEWRAELATEVERSRAMPALTTRLPRDIAGRAVTGTSRPSAGRHGRGERGAGCRHPARTRQSLRLNLPSRLGGRLMPPGRGLAADRGTGVSRPRTWSRVPDVTRTHQGASRRGQAVEASRASRRFPSGWWSGAGTVQACTEHEHALAGAGEQGVPVDALMSGLRTRRRTIGGHIGARLDLARESVGRDRTYPGHGGPLSLPLECSRFTARRSCAICVPERQALHGRQGASATSTRLLATWATFLIFSSAAVVTRPQCGHECGYKRIVLYENDILSMSCSRSLVDLGSTIFFLSVCGRLGPAVAEVAPSFRTA